MPMMCRNQISERQQLLNQINEVSFAVDDMLLYLDTHPCDQKALAYANEHIQERRRLMSEYARMYGPLTVMDSIEQCGESWKWAEQPFPWEQEGACR